MKLLRVISSVNPTGGGPIEGIRQLNAVLETMGHHIEVVSADGPDEPWVVNSEMKVHALGPRRSSYAYAPQITPWLRQHAPQFDAVIVHGLWQHHSFSTWQALHISKTPYFVYTHGMLDPWFKHTYPLKHLKKSLYWPWGEYRVLRDAKAVCFTCEEERILARQSFKRYRCNEAVVNYGTSGPKGDPDEVREVFLSRFPELRSKRVVLFLSRIHEKKGCDLLIEAFAKIAQTDSNLQLVMAGPDKNGWRTELEAQAAKLGIADRITWPGMLAGDLKWGAYYSAEVFALPSHQENFGIVVAEALACSVPVLISNKVNIWREIEADGAGLADDDTADGTTRLLQKWLALPETEKTAMKQKALKCFTERFEIRKAAESLLRVLATGK